MNYFQKYEKLKAANQLLTPVGVIKINYATETEVNFECMLEHSDYDYVKSDFLRHFRRCITD